MTKQVTEIDRIQRLQPLLIGAEQLTALAVGERPRIALGNVGGAKSLVFPAIDHHRKLACGPALVVQSLGLNELLQQPDHVVRNPSAARCSGPTLAAT